MPSFETFDRDVQLLTKDLDPKEISAALAKFARAGLAEAIASGEGSPIYEKFINGRPGAAEESVIAPGPIDYEFSWWPEIIEFALESLVKRSPEKSGRFKRNWFVMINDTRVASVEDIPIDSTVIVTNSQPYVRKVEVGHMKMSVPPGVVESVRLMVRRQYGAILNVRKSMITLRDGYILKGHFTKGIRPGSRTGLRRDTQAGQKLTYPALVLSMKV